MIITTEKQMRPRQEFEFYPTKIEDAMKAICFALPHVGYVRNILDAGAGDGIWCEAAYRMWPNALIWGIEIRPDVQRSSSCYRWITGNYMLVNDLPKFDLILGNPPYGDAWDEEQKRLSAQFKKVGMKYKRPVRPADQPLADAEAFVRKGLSHLAPHGILLQMLRLAFLESQDRGNGLWNEYKPIEVGIYSKRPSFIPESTKTDSTAYAAYLWREGSYHQDPRLKWLK